MTGSLWWDLATASQCGGGGLGGVGDRLGIVRPRGGLLREALRILPDALRLIRRLAADNTLPRGVRVRLALLLVYLAIPLDLIPDFIPVLATPTTPSSSPPCCGASCAAPASPLYAPTGPAATTASPRCAV